MHEFFASLTPWDFFSRERFLCFLYVGGGFGGFGIWGTVGKFSFFFLLYLVRFFDSLPLLDVIYTIGGFSSPPQAGP